jgi:photosystem II stability/assembly factor-like uncharacterized protein
VSSDNEKTFEPTMGAAPDGSLYFATTPGSGVAVGFGAGISRSSDGGATWSDVSAKVGDRRVPLETNDPYIYVDPATGRVFEFHMSPILTCSTLSYSDDGGSTWTTSPIGCGPTGAWDHQTMVAAAPRTLPTSGYPNILHQCVNAVYAEMCSRSLDGGLTWSPSTVAWPNDKASPGLVCGTQTGHLQAAPDGTVYLPTSDCATFPTVGISRDDGLTWERVKVADIAMPFEDPAVAVDGSGNAYVAFPDKLGQLWLVVSRDGGETWSEPVMAASRQVDAAKLAMTVGDDGKIAIAYVGTGGIPGQEAGKNDLDDPWEARWGAFITTSLDALSDAPTFTTLEVTGTDPLFNNAKACGPGYRCPYIVDFIEATVTPDGRPYGAFVDGCTEECATTPGARNNVSGTTGTGVVATVDVDLCDDRCAQFGPAPAGDPAPTAPAPAAPAAGGTALAPGESPLPGMDLAQLLQLRSQATSERLDLATGGLARPR